jgi:guanylate kinase
VSGISTHFTSFPRGTESEEQVQKRLKTAKAEMERSNDKTLFDYVLVNDVLADTYKQLKVSKSYRNHLLVLMY